MFDPSIYIFEKMKQKDEELKLGFNKYQEFVSNMPDFDDAALGLPGEVGEVIELVKKDRREGKYRQPLDKEKFTAELGDVIFYAVRLGYKNGVSFKEIIDYNIKKLTERHK